MKKQGVIFFTVCLCLLTLASCAKKPTEPSPPPTPTPPPTEKPVTLNISAAASLTDAMSEIQDGYLAESKDILEFNFGGSGALQKQIEEGAPCDLFISAAKSNMDTLEASGKIDKESRKDLLKNALVFIAAEEKKDKIKTFDALTSTDVGSIALGTPESVPAGKYAKQALEKLNVWSDTEKKIIYAKDVRQVLSYVETGNADCGFVYKSDTVLLKTAAIVCDVPSDLYDPVVYPMAIVSDSTQKKAAQAFCDFLQTDYAKDVFAKYGFEVK